MTGDKTLKITKPLFRNAEFDPATLDEESRTIEVSFSSETPVERYFGMEILGHRAGEIRLERLQSASPLLFNHDPDKHIGRIMEAKLDGSQGRAVVKFSKSAMGAEKMQDVRDGILREVSVGYRVHAVTKESEKDGLATYRVTDWEPLEISLVTIPADISVGAGRTHEPYEARITNSPITTVRTMENDNKPTTPTAPIDLEAERKKLLSTERERIAGLRKTARMAEEKGFKVDRMLVEKAEAGDADENTLMRQIFESQDRAPAFDDGKVLNDIQKQANGRTFSLLRSIDAMVSGRTLDGIEAEVITETAKSTGIRANKGGILIPFSCLSQRALSAGNFSQGGATVPVEMGPMIPLLDPLPVVQRAGATVLPGLTAPTNFPRQTAAAVAHWVAEQQQVEASTPGTDDVILTPHGLAAYAEISRRLSATSSIDVESWVRFEILKRITLGVDKAALTGSGTQGVPKGLFSLDTSNSGINTVTFGGAPTWVDITEFEGLIEDDDALEGSIAWITSAPVKAAWKATTKDTGSGMFLATEANTANGYPIYVTSQLKSTTFANRVAFGNWSSCLIGMYGAIEILVDQSAALQRRDLIGLTGMVYADVAFRHPESFAVSTDAGNQ